jgi:hypothetical protein
LFLLLIDFLYREEGCFGLFAGGEAAAHTPKHLVFEIASSYFGLG